MRGRSKSPRGNLSTTLLVRNLSHDCREKDLRSSFEKFGPLKDTYLPRDYYTGDPRGFGFIEFENRDDAAEEKDQMDGNLLLGRELSVMFGEANRKKPTEMRARQRSDGRFRDRRRSSPRYYSRSHMSSRSPPPYRRRHSRKEGYDRRRRSYSPSSGHSASPVTRKSRRRSINRSPSRRSISLSPSARRRRRNTPLPASRNRSRSPRRRSNTPLRGSRNRSPSPRRRRSNTPVPPARSRRSQSPRRRSNTPLPARSRSPRGDSPSQ